MSEHVNVSDAALADIEARLVEARCGSHELNLMIGVIAEKFDDREYTVAEGCKRLASPVTSSLDAAVSLAERVLPGSSCNWGVESWPALAASACSHSAFIAKPANSVDEHRFSCAKAATPALALCLAIIRALRASSKGDAA